LNASVTLAVVARESGRSSTPQLLGSSHAVSGTPDRPVKPGDDEEKMQ
jgi:hypothetical protein